MYEFGTAIRLNVILLILFNMLACSKLSNRVNADLYRCGDIPPLGEKNTVLKVEIFDNVNHLDIRSLNAEMVTDTSAKVDLQITSKSCVIVPNLKGALKVRALTDQGIFVGARTIEESSFRSNLLTMQLKQVRDPKIAVTCTKKGVFGKNVVKNPFRLIVEDGRDEASVAIRILAKSMSDQTVHILKEKTFGQLQGEAFSDLVIDNLAPGSYELQAAQESMSLSLNDGFSLIPDVPSCVLTKLAALPEFRALNEKTLFRPNEFIAEPIENVQYEYCVDSSEHSKNTLLCDASKCRGPWTSADFIRANSAGIYRYFARLIDRSGQNTNLVCQDVVVSAEAPSVDIQWANTKFSKKFSAFERPYASQKLNITTNHPQFGVNSKNIKTTCSAKFWKGGSFSINGDMVVCRSKECMDRAMGQEVPCGPNLEIDLTGAWDFFELWDSVLEVSAHSYDGLGQRSSSSVKVLFPASAIGIREFKPVSSETSETMTFLDSAGSDTVFSVGINKEQDRVIRVFNRSAFYDYKVLNQDANVHTILSTGKDQFVVVWQNDGICWYSIEDFGTNRLSGQRSIGSKEFCKFTQLSRRTDGDIIAVNCIGESFEISVFHDYKLSSIASASTENKDCSKNFDFFDSPNSLFLSDAMSGNAWELKNGVISKLEKSKIPLSYQLSSSSTSYDVRLNSRIYCDSKGVLVKGKSEDLYFPLAALIAKNDDFSRMISYNKSCENIFSNENSLFIHSHSTLQLFGSNIVDLLSSMLPRSQFSFNTLSLLGDEPFYLFEDGFHVYRDYKWLSLSQIIPGLKDVTSKDIWIDVTPNSEIVFFDLNNEKNRWTSKDYIHWYRDPGLSSDGGNALLHSEQKVDCDFRGLSYTILNDENCLIRLKLEKNAASVLLWNSDTKEYELAHRFLFESELDGSYFIAGESARLLTFKNNITKGIKISLDNPQLPTVSEVDFLGSERTFKENEKVYGLIPRQWHSFAIKGEVEKILMLRNERTFFNEVSRDSHGRFWEMYTEGIRMFDFD